jgi:hypothetical protein
MLINIDKDVDTPVSNTGQLAFDAVSASLPFFRVRSAPFFEGPTISATLVRIGNIAERCPRVAGFVTTTIPGATVSREIASRLRERVSTQVVFLVCLAALDGVAAAWTYDRKSDDEHDDKTQTDRATAIDLFRRKLAGRHRYVSFRCCSNLLRKRLMGKGF